MGFTNDQIAALQKPLEERHVKTREQARQRLSYVEAWHVVAEANRIFGFDGWSRETLEMRESRAAELVEVTNRKTKETYEQWRVGFVARVRVTAGGITRDGTGYGSGFASDLGDAYESAVKEAESDATKRALMTFGWPFGLALYDKSRENVASAPAPARQPPPARGNERALAAAENPFDDPPAQAKPDSEVYTLARERIRAASSIPVLEKLQSLVKQRHEEGKVTDKQYHELWNFAAERIAAFTAPVN